jgi:S-DNA-T family DNA segregation ATPase FtsK/SpoIIIE
MVDGPAEVGPGFVGRLMGAKRRAIVPAWLRSPTEFKTGARWAAGHYGHLAGYHALRSPYYAARLAFQSPRGAAKFVGGTMRWVADREGEPVRLASVRREDAAEYLKLSRQRDGRVRLRTLITVLAMFVGLGAALAIYVLAPGWLQALSVGAVLMALGSAGTQADAPVITRAVEMTKAPKLTSDIVLRALGALGITAINQVQSKGRDGFTFTAPITRDGPGWRAEGDLPYGVTVTDVIERRDKLASGLRRPLGCVWPEAVPDEHTGRLVLWVGDQDMSTATKPAWPLIKGGSVDLFKPVSFGTDQRGRWVDITLMYIAGVIGAIPRMGKTFLLRLLLLIAALDTRAEVLGPVYGLWPAETRPDGLVLTAAPVPLATAVYRPYRHVVARPPVRCQGEALVGVRVAQHAGVVRRDARWCGRQLCLCCSRIRSEGLHGTDGWQMGAGKSLRREAAESGSLGVARTGPPGYSYFR